VDGPLAVQTAAGATAKQSAKDKHVKHQKPLVF
jgi:hypothetical protein